MIDSTPLEKTIELINKGNNIFITGGGGVGKSYILGKLKEYYGDALDITSTTGISAINVGGQTIHSWAGIGIANKSVNYVVNYKIRKNKSLEKHIKECKLLAIDEVSMMSDILIKYLDEVLQKVRNNSKPFGGLQVILIGDFFQIPPVNKNKENTADVDFCFNSLTWYKLNLSTIYLKEVKRQKDKKYIEALNNIRVGNVTQEACKLFESRNFPTNYKFDKNILHIFAKNKDADNHNKKCFDELPEKPYTYSAKDTFYRYNPEDGKCIETITIDNNIDTMATEELYLINKFNSECRSPKELVLKESCRVMLLKNIDISKGLVNGICGTVKKLTNTSIEVLFDNGISKSMNPVTFDYIYEGKTKIKRQQYPLMLAYAINNHKSQGMTFDKLVVNFHDIFQDGMGYVVLSRTRTLDGLYLKGFDCKKIETSQKVIQFYKDLESNPNCYVFGEQNQLPSEKDSTDGINNDENETEQITAEEIANALGISVDTVINIIESQNSPEGKQGAASFLVAIMELLTQYPREEVFETLNILYGPDNDDQSSGIPSETTDENKCSKAYDEFMKVIQIGKLCLEFSLTYEEASEMLENKDYEEVRMELQQTKKNGAVNKQEEIMENFHQLSDELSTRIEKCQNMIKEYLRSVGMEPDDENNEQEEDINQEYRDENEKNSFISAFVKYNQKDYDAALKLFNECIKESPDNDKAYFYIGSIYEIKEDYTNAITNYTKAINLQPESVMYLDTRANAYFWNKDYKKALKDWDKVLELEPDFEINYFNKAHAKNETDKYSEAIDDYTRYLKNNPDDSNAYNNRGNSKYYLQDYTGAIKDYNRAIKLAPKSAVYYNHRANAYFWNKDYKKALKDWDKVLELEPDFEINYFNKAHAEDETDKYSEAINDYTRYLKNNPDDSSAYNNRGICKFNLQDYTGAIKDYNHAIKLEPERAKYYNNRAHAYFWNKDYKKALKDWDKVLELDSEYDINYFFKASSEYKNERYKEAINDFTKYLESHPNDADSYSRRGVCKARLDDYIGAIEDCKKALATEPDNLHYLEFCEVCYYKAESEYESGQYAEAIDTLTQYLGYKPDDADMLDYRAEIYYKNKEYKNAIDDWSKAIELDPDSTVLFFDNLGSENAVYLAVYANTYYKNKEYEKAVDNWNKLDDIEPDYIDYFNKAYAEFELKQYTESIEDYTRYLEDNPNDASCYNNRGVSKYYSEDYCYEDAIEDYSKALNLVPDKAMYLNNRANAYYEIKEYKKAIFDYNKAIELEPQYNVNYYCKAYSEYMAGMYQEASLSIEKYLNNYPNDENALNLRTSITSKVNLIPKYVRDAKIYLENNYYEEAYKVCEKILGMDKNNTYAYLYIGVYHYFNQNYAEAEKYYKKAIKLDSSFCKAYINLGIALHSQGKYKQAIKYYNKALELEPSLDDVRTRLEEATANL